MEVKQLITLVVCFLEATILGDALFGWPSLVYVLQGDNLYSSVCEEVETNSSLSYNTSSIQANTSQYEQLNMSPVSRCFKQKELLSEPFTVGTVTFGISAFPIGLFFDRFGLRVTRTLFMLIGVMSYLQIALASEGTEWMLMTGAFCIGLSCYALVMTSCHVAQLAGSKTSTVTALYMGGVESSFAFQAVKLAKDNGVPRLYSLLCIGAMWFLVLFSSWCLLPPYKVYMDYSKDATTKGYGKVINEEIIQNGQTKSKESSHIQHDQRHSQSTLKGFLFSGTFVLFLYWFCALHVRVNMMTDGYDTWITGVVNGDIKKVSYYTDLMAYANILGTFPSALVGIITDRLRKSTGTHPRGTQLALVPAVTLTTLILICMNVPLFCHTELGIYFAVFLYAFGKPYVYSTASSFMTLLCPAEHYGLVYGVVYLLSGVAAFAIYPYLIWVTATGTFTPVNTMMLTSLILSLAFPTWLLYTSTRQENEPDQEKKYLIQHHEE